MVRDHLYHKGTRTTKGSRKNVKSTRKSQKIPFLVIPAPHQVRDKLQPESSKFNNFWMPDQVWPDGSRTFYEFNNYPLINIKVSYINIYFVLCQ